MGWWDDFANNLATDLGPLISLFGEAPTMQYLSETTTSEDIIIFSMAPIGILTAVVSAIRVCGSPSLRAFIGRAQEGAGAAEVELCSSSSRNVGELFNSGGGIARVFGRPKLLEIMHDPQAAEEDFRCTDPKEQGTAGIYLPSEYFGSERSKKEWKEISRNGQEVKRGQLKYDDASSKSLEPRGQQIEPDNDQPYLDIERQSSSGRTVQAGNSVMESAGHEDLRNTKAAVPSPGFAPSPNISLNVGINPVARKWFILSAALGIVLQSAVLVWAAVARYKFNLVQSDSTAGYAVPATVIGTVMVSFGVGLCAYLVDGSTNERRFQRTPGTTRLFWIQPGNQQLGDQMFDSFAVKGDLYRNYITSWKKTPEEEKEDKERIKRRWGKVLKVLTRLEERAKCSQYFGASTWHWFLRKCQRFFFEGTVWIAIFTTLIGFILQFLGLRASHSSVSVFQLGVMLLMSIVRGLLRTERLEEGANLMKEDSRKIREGADENSEDPETYIGHEISWLALRLHRTGEERTWTVACFDSASSTKDLPFTRVISRLWRYPISESKIEIAPTSVSISFEGSRQIIGFKQHDVGKNHDQNGISDHDLRLEWLRKQRCDESKEHPQPTHDAVEVFLYRTRLAHLTKDWDDKFVAGREVARRLAQAIEETADIIFAKFNLIPEWENVAKIYWPVQCQIEGSSGAKDIFLSLERDLTSTEDPGHWKVDICELEAVLGLWLWAIQGKGIQSTTRLLWQWSRHDQFNLSEDLITTYGFDAWRERKQPTVRKANIESNATETWQLSTRLSTPQLCAQELYSFFFTSIANTFNSVGGKDTVIRAQQFYLKNQNIAMIQAAFADSGLGSQDDAWACIFPVLNTHQKLASIFHFIIDARLSSMVHQKVTHQGVQVLNNVESNGRQKLAETGMKIDLRMNNWRNGEAINAKNSAGSTALHLAIKFQCGSIAQKLLEIGADSNLADKDGETPLLTAVSQNSEDHVKILLENDADPGKPGYDGDAPLHRAARHGYSQLVLILLDKKVDINLPGKGGATALHQASEHFKVEVLEILLQKGANPNIPDHNGSTPLKRAANFGYLSGVQMLLDKGADVECPDVNGETPLHKAVGWKSCLEIFQLLLGSGANPNARTITGDTPLHYGIGGHGTEEVVEKLLAAGAKPNVQNNSGETPLDKAVDYGLWVV